MSGAGRLQHFGLGRCAAFAVSSCAILLASLAAAPGILGGFGAALGFLMLAIAAVDAKYFVIPDELTLSAFGLALAHAAMLGAPGLEEAVALALARGILLGLAFLALRIFYRAWRGREGLGLGDVKLAGVAGAWLDFMLMPIAIEIAALSALGFYLIRHFVAGRRLTRTTRLPFGLFLAPSIWLAWLMGAVLFPA
jgi:leader peptidase (prepilin peptidase)/N-methyltransferase